MGGFLIQEWELSFPECGGTSTLSPGATLAAHWLHVSASQSAFSRWGWGFHIERGGIDPGDHCVPGVRDL